MNTAVSTTRPVPGATPEEPTRRLRPFDFRNPKKLSRDHLRRLELTHEVFTRILGNELSTALRTLVRLELMAIDQITYDEYVRSMPNPTVIGRLSLDPLPGNALIELSTQTGLTLVDRLLGGMGKPGPTRRPTELEGILLNEVLSYTLPALAETFEPILPIQPQLTALEYNPNFVQAANPSEMVAVMSYSISILQGVHSDGLLTVCYPFALLQPALTEHEGDADEEQRALPAAMQRGPLGATLPDVAVPISVHLRASRIPARDLADLRPGDVLRLDHKVNEPVHGTVSGLDLLRGQVGRKGKNLAIRLSDWRTP